MRTLTQRIDTMIVRAKEAVLNYGQPEHKEWRNSLADGIEKELMEMTKGERDNMLVIMASRTCMTALDNLRAA